MIYVRPEPVIGIGDYTPLGPRRREVVRATTAEAIERFQRTVIREAVLWEDEYAAIAEWRDRAREAARKRRRAFLLANRRPRPARQGRLFE